MKILNRVNVWGRKREVKNGKEEEEKGKDGIERDEFKKRNKEKN